MGFFDKVKHFAGGHGVKARITEIERQDPGSVQFPLTDSVMKFNITVEGEKEATVLAHDFEVWIERTTQGSERIVQVASDRHDASTDIIGADIKWPYALAPGRPITDGCCIGDVDLAAALKKMDVSDPTQALNSPDYRFFVKFVADVKGSPMDAEATADFTVTA
ncbi:MAG: hypothetical protein ABIJ09_14890 [Pseudomonadota bacterium]